MYKVQSNLRHDGTSYEKGDEVNLSKEEAKELEKIGVVVSADTKEVEVKTTKKTDTKKVDTKKVDKKVDTKKVDKKADKKVKKDEDKTVKVEKKDENINEDNL